MTRLSGVRYLVTAGVWAGCAAAAVFWGLRLFVPAAPVPAEALAVGSDQALRGDPARLFSVAVPASGGVAAPALASRFRLVGVVASVGAIPSGGVALIAIDGKPPSAYHVGASVEGDLVLQAVEQRTAQVGPADGAPAFTLELPTLPPPATGTLPAAEVR